MEVSQLPPAVLTLEALRLGVLPAQSLLGKLGRGRENPTRDTWLAVPREGRHVALEEQQLLLTKSL